MIKANDSLDNCWFWSESLAEELRQFLTRRLRCPETAADLTHETYLRLYQRGRDNPPDNARALAFHIAMNLAVDYQRKVSVRNRYLVDDDFDALVETTSGLSHQPEHILSSRQRLHLVQTALHELPYDCRNAFLMHGVEGLTYSQIAERMGISVAMVGKHLARAMAHCAQRLGD